MLVRSGRFPDIEDHAAYGERLTKAQCASFAVLRAVANGKLIRPDTCELCGRQPGYTQDGRPKIHAHHWRGYDHRLDVWWICDVCNHRLWGKEFHNGSVTKEQAREFVTEYEKYAITHVPRPCKAIVKTTGEPCRTHTTIGDYCISHRRAIERGNKVTAKD